MNGNRGGNCWNCANELTSLDYGRADTCRKCGRDTRACLGCEFFDKTCNNQCREPQADRVVDKERSNFCEYFKPKAGVGSGSASRDTMKAAAEALFRKK